MFRTIYAALQVIFHLLVTYIFGYKNQQRLVRFMNRKNINTRA